MKGMESYGYHVYSTDLKEFKMDGAENFNNLKSFVKLAYDDQLELNTKHIEELLDRINDDNLEIYKSVLKGEWEIRKGDQWKENLTTRKMIVKNVEVFEKVIPICISLSKQYTINSIKEIFEYCRNKNGTFNFAAIGRIRTLVNIMYNDKNERLDLPIKEYMTKVYEFSELGVVHKNDIKKFVGDFARQYAIKESTNQIVICHSVMTIKELIDKFEKIFKCLIKTSRPKKDGKVEMERIELLWKEKEYFDANIANESIYILNDFLDILKDVDSEIINEVDNNDVDEIFK
jgi:hypothetical protein